MAFWLSHQPFWQEGDLHGISLDKFVGVGVVFDTFKNTDHGTYYARAWRQAAGGDSSSVQKLCVGVGVREGVWV